jgi:hypothetical protein
MSEYVTKFAEKDESQALLPVHFYSSFSVFEGIRISNKCGITVDCTYVSLYLYLEYYLLQ